MRLLWAVVVGMAFTGVQPALAADAPGKTPSAAQAERLFREARSLLDQGRYREACRTFERSLELDASPGTLLNLGNCYEEEGDLVRALAAFERAVADSQGERNVEKRRAWIEGGTRRASSLRARVPVLELHPSPTPGAIVQLDGEVLAQVGGPQRVNPGRHSLEVSAPEKRTFRREIELKLADQLDLPLPELENAVDTGGAAAAARPRLRDSAPPPSRRASLVPWVFMGGGALLSATGVVTALMAKSKEDALDGGCGAGPICRNPSLRSTRDSGQRLEVATYLLWAAGGASAIAGLTLFALDDPEEAGPTEFSAGCFAGSCGVLATGSF